MHRATWLLILTFAGCGGGEGTPPPTGSDDALRYCVMLMSCTFEMVGAAASCVRDVQLAVASGAPTGFIRDARDISRQVACAASANDCASMLECRARGRMAGFCTGIEAAFCDGDTAVLCQSESYPAAVDDCSERGLTCHSIGATGAVCTNGVTCDADAPRCAGAVRFYCVDGVVAPDDCMRVWPGATCALVANELGEPTPTCVPPGADCSADRCDGGALVRCIGGHELHVDCAAVEGSCEVGAEGPECVSTASECTPSSSEACDGDSVQVCVNGRYAALDCADIGLRTCGVHISGGSACVP